MTELEFLFEEPVVPFRSVKRKGALRYIASKKCGSLATITRFSPPTNILPKLVLGLAARVDFRVPGLADPIQISQAFLEQAAALLEIPIERIGIYVGEPNDQQKLVVTDVSGVSRFVLKISAGKEAGQAILREAEGIERALGAGPWAFGIPDVQRIDPVCGQEAILIERIQGKQLTPEEFERVFFGKECGVRDYVLGVKGGGVDSLEGTENTECVSVDSWLDRNLKLNTENLKPLIDACCQTGALDLRSPLGIVHGDFAPWNTIRVSESSVRSKVLRVKQGQNLKLNRLKPKTFDGDSLRLCAIDWEFSRADTPLIFDQAYAAWCFDELLGRTVSSVDPELWQQLVALGALWRELRNYPNA